MTHAEQIAARCVKHAKAQLGAGWEHVSRDVRWGLVCAEIVSVMAGQDDSVSDTAFREYFNELRAAASVLIFPK